jgi:hypothetical protein
MSAGGGGFSSSLSSSEEECRIETEEGGLGVLLLLLLFLWKTALESMLQKNSFHTRKKFRFSMTTRVRSRLAYPEDAPFPICF